MRYHELVHLIQEKGGFDSQEQARTAIRATLSSLGECLYRTERRHLASQLPKPAKEFLHEYLDSEVTRPPTGCHTLQEFYDRVAARADVTRGRGIERAKLVVAALRDLIPEGEWKHILEEMPKEFRELLTGEDTGLASSVGS